MPQDDNSEGGGKSLEEFGYCFVDGKLKDLETGGPFQFKWSHGSNQQMYEEFAEAITVHVYKLLEEEAGLSRIYIPIDAEADEPRGFFFASDDAWTNEKLVVLINGSGLVRAGQWSRKLIINRGLDEGSMLPYIQRAKARGYGIVVMNTNENKGLGGAGTQQYIRVQNLWFESVKFAIGHSGVERSHEHGSEDPPSHAHYVWTEFISKAKAKKIAIVAHSAGGYTTVRLADSVTEDFVNRVFAVCLTDSAHVAGQSDGWEHLKKVARNWALSTKILDTQLSPHRSTIKQVSAGTMKHDDTCYLAINSVFNYIDEKEMDA